MPRVQDAIPSLDCRAWKGRSNLLLLSALRFAPESRLVRLSTFQQASIARWTPEAGIMPSPRPANFSSSCLSRHRNFDAAGGVRDKAVQRPPILQDDRHIDLRRIDPWRDHGEHPAAQ